MDNERVKRLLREEAGREGFPVFGVAPAELGPEPKKRFLSWISKSYHADMMYLSTRRDVVGGLSSVVAGARSVAVLGLPYARRERGNPAQKPADAGWVARYARGRDYHRVMEKPLKRLARFLSTFGGEARAYVDYGPVMERAYAARAGVGFIGKNGCLIHETYGSWLFLGVIVTSLELPPDAPLSATCGDCRKCLAACPTGALQADRMVDSRRCLSYLTVESKEEISEEIRPLMQRWILGCDACQRVCPFNQSSAETDVADFLEERIPSHLSLSWLLSLDEDAFREHFSGTAAMRPGWQGMRRNARAVLKNIK